MKEKTRKEYQDNLTYSLEARRLNQEFGDQINFLEIPENLLVKAIPAFGGAVIRYLFTDKLTKSKNVSVYFDCEDRLGYMGQPYYEIYLCNEPERFLVGQEKEMIEAVERLLKEWQIEKNINL